MADMSEYRRLRGALEAESWRDGEAGGNGGEAIEAPSTRDAREKLDALFARIVAERDAARADAERLREALERIVGMCDVPSRCGTCGRPNGIPAVVLCARAAIDAARKGGR
jgi:hypothetical protein